MATTGEDIFKSSLALMGERSDAVNIEDYIDRAVPLLNLIFIEIYNFIVPFNGGVEELDGGEDSDSVIDGTVRMQEPEKMKISSLSDTVNLDDRLTGNVIPYALAARLLLEEDPERASFFDAEYEKNLKTIQNFRGKIMPIKRVCF